MLNGTCTTSHSIFVYLHGYFWGFLSHVSRSCDEMDTPTFEYG